MPSSNPAWDEAYAAALKKSSSAKAQQPKERTTDIDLPNESGEVDPRLTTPKEKLSLDALTKRVDALMGKK